MFGDERASAKEISLLFCVTSMSGLSDFRDNESEDARANVQSPHLRLFISRNYWVSSHTSNFSTLVYRILRYGDWVHVRTCRDVPPHPRLVESTYLVTPIPHTKFEHNRPSRFRDTEARCGCISAHAHVQRYPIRDCCISCNYIMGPQVHANFQRNRPNRYRETTGGTFVTSPQVARATCHSRH